MQRGHQAPARRRSACPPLPSAALPNNHLISLLLPLVLGRGALLSWTAHLRTSAILAEATTHMLSATAGQL